MRGTALSFLLGDQGAAYASMQTSSKLNFAPLPCACYFSDTLFHPALEGWWVRHALSPCQHAAAAAAAATSRHSAGYCRCCCRPSCCIPGGDVPIPAREPALVPRHHTRLTGFQVRHAQRGTETYQAIPSNLEHENGIRCCMHRFEVVCLHA